MGMLLAPNLIASMKSYGIKYAALFDGSTGYLSRTPGVAGNQQTWTYSSWVSPSNFGVYQDLFWVNTVTYDYFRFNLNETMTLGFGGASVLEVGNVFRDRSAYYHIVLAVDTTQAIASDRVKLYVNGTQVTAFTSTAYPVLNATTNMNSTALHYLGNSTIATQYYSGPLAETIIVDGQALTPSDFGKFDITTGNWVAKKYLGTYGANGFHLDFAIAGVGTLGADLGADISGNGNHWATSATGLSQVTSTPTNVYDVFNPLDGAATYHSLSNGNRTSTTSSTVAVEEARGSILLNAGKWYWETLISNVGSGGWAAGITPNDGIWRTAANAVLYGYFYKSDGQKTVNNVNSAYGASYTTADVIGTAVDFNALTITFYKNNVSQGAIPIAAGSYLTCSGLYGAPSVAVVAFAESDWVYAAPTGHKSICTDNLPKITDSIDNHFRALKYVGNGAATQRTDIVWGGTFQPNFVWGKNRSAIADHYIHDELRGVTNALASNLTAAQSGPAGFASDGFGSAGVLDQFRIYTANAIYNALGQNYITFGASLPKTASTWGFGETVTPSGEIYNDSAMFKMSVVTYTGNGVAGASLPHSLGVKPGFIIIKKLSDAVDYWQTYHSAIGATKSTQFNTGVAAIANVGYWNNTEPTSTLITLGTSTGMNQNTSTYVAYIFAPCDGIKIGSYLGNASSDGPFLNENISPVWMLHKADTVANWNIWDASRSRGNPVKETVFAESSAAETSLYNRLDFTSMGMKGRDGTVHPSSFTGTNLYMMIGQPSGPTENTAR